MKVVVKTLDETIRESKILSELDNFDKHVLTHLTITYFKKNVYCLTNLVSEKYGTYEDLNSLSSFVYKKVISYLSKNNHHKDTLLFVFKNSEFKNLKNIFFEQLELTIVMDENKVGEGDYISEYSILNKESLLFDKVCVTIFTDKWLSDFEIALQHELTHAYENWNRQLKNDKSFINKSNTEFSSSIQNTLNDNSLQKFLKDFLYFTLNSEQNAFAAELTAVLKKNNKIIKTPLDALEVLKSTQIYQTYKGLYLAIMEYDKGNVPKNIENQIASEYNRICKTDITPNKVFKKLKHLIKKSLNKFDTLIAKLCCESLNNISIIVDNRRTCCKYNITEL